MKQKLAVLPPKIVFGMKTKKRLTITASTSMWRKRNDRIFYDTDADLQH